MPTFRGTRKGKKCVFVTSLRLSDHKVLHNAASSLSFFSISLGFSYFKFLEFKEFNKTGAYEYGSGIKQLFHSRLLDMRLFIANSALRASLVIYHLISNARSWNNC